MRLVRRVLAVIVAAVVVFVGASGTPAAAEDTKPSQERLEMGAETACKNMPGSWNDWGVGNIQQLCKDMVLKIIDPDQSISAQAACTAVLPIALPGVGAWITESCVENLTPLGLIAEKTVGGVVAGVECVVSTNPGDIFGCYATLAHRWIANGAASLWTDLVGVLLAPTQAVSMIDLEDFTPSAAAAGFRSVYGDIGILAMFLITLLLLWSLIQAALRRSLGRVRRGLQGVLEFGLFWVSGMALLVMILNISDGATAFLAGEHGEKLAPDAEKIAAWLDKIAGPFSSGTTVTVAWVPGSLVGLLVVGVLVLALLVNWVTLAIREVSLVLMAAGIPLVLALRASEDTSKALPKVAAAMVTVAAAKPLMVIGLRISAGFMGSVEPDEAMSLQAAFVGVLTFIITAFFPGVLYKLLGVGFENVGQRVGNGPTAAEQFGRGTVDAIDMSRQVAQANHTAAPAANPASTSTSSSAAGKSGAAAAAGGGGSTGAKTGASAAAKTGGRVPAMPLVGAAVAVGSTIAGAGTSAVRHGVSLAATGGGALGDPEQAHIPTFPRSYGPMGPNSPHPEPAPSAPPAPTQPPTPPPQQPPAARPKP